MWTSYKTLRAVVLALLLLTGFTFASKAYSQEKISLSALEGRWLSTSPAFGSPAASELKIVPALSGKFHQLSYKIHRSDDDGETLIFEGAAFYKKTAPGEYEAAWADSTGDLLPVKTKAEDSALVANWGVAGVKQGRTRYELTSGGSLIVTDHILQDDEWVQFNQMEFARETAADKFAQRHVTGIGGLFFRGDNPAALANWYAENFSIDPAPTSYEQEPWRQDAGYTVFAPFEQSTEHFGDVDKQWMVNFRVRDLDRLVSTLRARGIEVSDPETFPNGRFSRLTDPEGNPIELWEPSE